MAIDVSSVVSALAEGAEPIALVSIVVCLFGALLRTLDLLYEAMGGDRYDPKDKYDSGPFD